MMRLGLSWGCFGSGPSGRARVLSRPDLWPHDRGWPGARAPSGQPAGHLQLGLRPARDRAVALSRLGEPRILVIKTPAAQGRLVIHNRPNGVWRRPPT